MSQQDHDGQTPYGEQSAKRQVPSEVYDPLRRAVQEPAIGEENRVVGENADVRYERGGRPELPPLKNNDGRRRDQQPGPGRAVRPGLGLESRGQKGADRDQQQVVEEPEMNRRDDEVVCVQIDVDIGSLVLAETSPSATEGTATPQLAARISRAAPAGA